MMKAPKTHMIASAFDSLNDDRAIAMLLGLTAEDAFFYSHESHLTDTAGKA